MDFFSNHFGAFNSKEKLTLDNENNLNLQQNKKLLNKKTKFQPKEIKLNNIEEEEKDNLTQHNSSVISFDKKCLFKTEKNNHTVNIESLNDENMDMKKMMRLLKNRLSAKKCRQKKKSYVETLEIKLTEMTKELLKLKQIEKEENKIEVQILNVKNIFYFSSFQK